jgi:protein arginine kinase activator
MLCEACKERTATIHLTEVNNGQRSETHLCQQCANQQGLTIKSQIPLNELLNTLLSTKAEKTTGEDETVPTPGTEHVCPVCGMTLRRFAKEPLLGCPHDYTEFQPELMPLIEKSQNGKSHHCGKVPTRTNEQDRNQIELAKLRRQLEQAVKNEDYENAAKLRDQIQALQ